MVKVENPGHEVRDFSFCQSPENPFSFCITAYFDYLCMLI
jgi:hypothetical protein